MKNWNLRNQGIKQKATRTKQKPSLPGGLPGCTSNKESPADAGDIRDVGSVPRPGRCLGGGHGNPLQYSCLKNPMDRGAWWATVHGVAKSWTRLSTAHTSWYSKNRNFSCLPPVGYSAPLSLCGNEHNLSVKRGCSPSGAVATSQHLTETVWGTTHSKLCAQLLPRFPRTDVPFILWLMLPDPAWKFCLWANYGEGPASAGQEWVRGSVGESWPFTGWQPLMRAEQKVWPKLNTS